MERDFFRSPLDQRTYQGIALTMPKLLQIVC
jgi:hypothetical protein